MLFRHFALWHVQTCTLLGNRISAFWNVTHIMWEDVCKIRQGKRDIKPSFSRALLSILKITFLVTLAKSWNAAFTWRAKFRLMPGDFRNLESAKCDLVSSVVTVTLLVSHTCWHTHPVWHPGHRIRSIRPGHMATWNSHSNHPVSADKR